MIGSLDSKSKSSFLYLFLILASLVLLYSVSLGHNFLFDEENIILHNRFIKDMALWPEVFRHGYFPFEEKSDEVWNIYYRPLTSLTFAFDYSLWKTNPLGYNLTNLALHALVSGLLFFLLRALLKNEPAAFLATLLCAIHTCHTEAVTYIASRGDLLGAFFVLIAIHLYRRGRWRWALFAYFLGLFSKESVLLLPVYLLLLEVSFGFDSPKNTVKRLSPFLCVAALFIVFRAYLSPAPLGPPTQDLREAVLRVFSMGPPFLNYLSAIFYPEEFKFCLSIPFATTWTDPRVLLTLFIFALLFAALVLSWRRRGVVLFGYGIFLLGLLPASQWIHYEPEWAEHYLYFAGMGLALLLGAWIAFLFSRKQKVRLLIFLGLYSCFLVFIGYRTWQRNLIYNDTDGYYERLSSSDSPYASFGYGYRARVAIEENRWQDAIVPLKTANAMNPKQHMVYDWMGLYYFQKGSYPEALANFNKAYEFCRFHNSKHLAKVAMTLYQMGRLEESAKIYERIQKDHPKEEEIYTNLLMTYELLGDPERAGSWAKRGLEELRGAGSGEVLLAMVYLRLAYRQGWDLEVSRILEYVLTRYPDAHWYGDIARLLKGELTPEAFESLRLSKYPGLEFDEASRYYVLMAMVLQKKATEVRSYLEKNGAWFEASLEQKPLFARELGRARTFLAENP